MTLPIIIAAFAMSTLDAGDTYTFTNAIGALPETVPFVSDVGANDTPGSTNWYVRIDSIRVPLHWDVTSNGVHVALEEEPVVRPERDHGPWNLAIFHANRAIGTYVPNMFDVKWNDEHAIYYAIATNMTDLSTEETYGRKLYWMKAHKENSAYYYSQIASMNAYFERIYFGSYGNTDFYEPRTQPGDFEFDKTLQFGGLTNRQSTAYDHRLVEHQDVTNFLRHVLLMSSELYEKSEYGKPFEGVVHYRAFANDADSVLNLEDDSTERELGVKPNDTHVWWASTREPPLQRQDIGNDDWITPTEGGVSDLMPRFDWTVDAIAYQLDGHGWMESKPWQLYSVCLGWFFGGVAPHPVSELFKAVGHVSSAGPLGMIRKYDLDDGSLGFLRGTYPLSFASVPNEDDADLDYVNKCLSGAWVFSRRLSPGQMVGANQILGIMDRTILIPSMLTGSKPVNFSASASASYRSSETFHAEAHWNETEGKFILDGTNDVVFTGTRSDYEENLDYDLSDDYIDSLRVSVSPVSIPEPTGSYGFPPLQHGDVLLDDGTFDSFAERIGSDFAYVSINSAGTVTGQIELWLDIWDGPGEYRTMEQLLIPAGWTDLILELTPGVDVVRSYGYTLPQYPEEGLEANLVIENRLTENESVSDYIEARTMSFLDRRYLEYALNSTGRVTTVTDYKCDGQDGGDSLHEVADSHMQTLIDGQIQHAKDLVGNFEDIGSFVQLPSEATFKIKGSHAFLLRDEPEVIADQYPEYYNLPYESYSVRGEFPLGLGVFTTNKTIQTETDEETVVAVATEWMYKTEEGWVFNSAETNVISSETRPVSSNEVTEAGVPSVVRDSPFSFDYSVEFDEFTEEDAVLDYFDPYVVTNLIELTYTTNTTIHVYDDFVVTNIMTDMTADPPTVTTNVEERSFSYETTDASSKVDEHTDVYYNVPWNFTRADAERYATSITTNELTQACPVDLRIFPDHTWTKSYANPFTGEEEPLGSGRLPLEVGTWNLELVADEKNKWELGTPSAFSGNYKNDVKFKAIEAVDWRFKSMKRDDLTDK